MTLKQIQAAMLRVHESKAQHHEGLPSVLAECCWENAMLMTALLNECDGKEIKANGEYHDFWLDKWKEYNAISHADFLAQLETVK